MKYLVCAAAFIASLLGGCAKTERWEIDQATAVCTTHGGVAEIVNITGSSAHCMDGTILKLHRPEDN